MPQLKIPAVYMRGGTSKGVFFREEHLPTDASARDALLLRLTGSPDPYGKQIDGMGGATSSTSKVVLISPSQRPDCDVDYLFGAVSIEAAVIDWSGNCGNLTAAVGPFALGQGLVAAQTDGTVPVRIWQVNTKKKIVAHVPVKGGQVVEEGDFRLDGVAFPGAEIKLEFLDPAGSDDGGAMFPTGRPTDELEVPGEGRVIATLINAGNPTVIITAQSIGLRGDELQPAVNSNPELLRRCEAIRAQAAVTMGLAVSAAEATAKRPATPKLVFVSPPRSYTASDGRLVAAAEIDFIARILSMGQLHHAMTGTGAIALAVAASIPGTLVQGCLAAPPGAGGVRIGHPSGSVTSAAEASVRDGQWAVSRVVLSRTARVLMEGWVRVPR